MKRYIVRISILLLFLPILVSCGQPLSNGKLDKVGMLLSDTINDQVWGTKGYKGLLKIQSAFDVEVYYKEGISTDTKVERAVKEFDQKGVNLIFGHGEEFAEHFNRLAEFYPHIHFVSFNGKSNQENTTSLHFEAYSMGFFGGMVASHMTESNKIGVIGAYEWQPEIEGFYDGALFENENVHVQIQYVSSWYDKEGAIEIVNKMINDGIDVFYPTGDDYTIPVIEKVKEEGLYAIGYVSDQIDLGESTVLTSTVQHVDKLYELIADQYNKGKLQSGTLSFDFQDDVIALGEFSPLVDKEYQKKIKDLIIEYKNSGKLPNES